jgi:hypothetical protein
MPVSITLGIGKDLRIIVVTQTRAKMIMKLFSDTPTLEMIREICRMEGISDMNSEADLRAASNAL